MPTLILTHTPLLAQVLFFGALLSAAAPDGLFPPQLAGLLASIAGMFLGSLAPQWYGTRIRA
jgi:hypothetical protein